MSMFTMIFHPFTFLGDPNGQAAGDGYKPDTRPRNSTAWPRVTGGLPDREAAREMQFKIFQSTERHNRRAQELEQNRKRSRNIKGNRNKKGSSSSSGAGRVPQILVEGSDAYEDICDDDDDVGSGSGSGDGSGSIDGMDDGEASTAEGSKVLWDPVLQRLHQRQTILEQRQKSKGPAGATPTSKFDKQGSFSGAGAGAAGSGTKSCSSGRPSVDQQLLHLLRFDEETEVYVIVEDCICNFWNSLNYKF